MHATHVRISPDPEIQHRYERMRALGESHGMAEVLALRTFPAVKETDSAFNKGRCNGNQSEGAPALGDLYRKMAEDAGVSTTGKQYLHGMAEFPGDPAAWVNGTSDVLRVAREKGFHVQGAVEYTPPPSGQRPGPRRRDRPGDRRGAGGRLHGQGPGQAARGRARARLGPTS